MFQTRSLGADHQQLSILMIAYTNYETDPRVIRAAEAAVDAGFAVDVIALSRAGQPAEELTRGVRVFRVRQERYRGGSRVGYVRAYLGFFCRCAWLSTKMFVKQRYQVIHVNNMPDVLVFSVIIPRLFGAKVLLDIHDPMPETLSAKYAGTHGNSLYSFLLWLEQLSVAFANKTVTVNAAVKDGILLKHGYHADAIKVITNFADDRIFRPMVPQPIEKHVRFVFHGTILARYGLRTLVEAAAKVSNRDGIHIRILGEGDFSATLKDLIKIHNVEDIVEFVNRVYPVHEIPGILADCHVGLVPLDITPISDQALPLKLLEYTCLGMPSITVRSTAISYYLRPDECMFYAPGDSTALARLLDHVAEEPKRLDEYRTRLAGARERMSWSREKEKYVGLLHELAGAVAPSECRVRATHGSSK
jgi:glycosyltransferase involved in cell wall biosynthesis